MSINGWKSINLTLLSFVPQKLVVFWPIILPRRVLYQNLMIEANIIHASHENAVKKLIFLGSSCIYPKHSRQPIEENNLLTGTLEKTNEWYAMAKIAV